MQKPSYKDLEKQIKTLKGNVKGLNESKREGGRLSPSAFHINHYKLVKAKN
tara:strand:+ start:693 stop:845 length:153 start_codon:yes stop_codon:yes gene_type:complete